MIRLTPENLDVEVARLAWLLPPFPSVVMELLDMTRDEEVLLNIMVHLARSDPVILASILAAANRLHRIPAKPGIHDPFVAASLIGMNQLRRIVITTAINKFALEENGADFLQGHARAVAIVAHELAMLTDILPEKAYVAAMLHDVGQLCLHVMDPASFRDIYQQSVVDGKIVEREEAYFGFDHAGVGSKLAELWQLPEDYVRAIRWHHDDTAFACPLQVLINVAESLTRALDIPPSPRNRLTKLNAKAVAELGIDWSSPEMLDCFGRCRARFHQALG